MQQTARHPIPMSIVSPVLIGKAMGICLKEFTLHFNVYKNQADTHCLVNQNKVNNRHWGLGVPPSGNV